MHQLFSIRGKEQDTVNEVPAGDIAAVAKLADVGTGDVLVAKGTTLDVDVLPAPEPLLAVAIHAKSKGDEDKLANALHRLQEEDPVLRIERNAETHQTVLRGMGETHLSIATEKLARKFGVEVETEEVRVAYRETIAGDAEAEGKFKKQSGGHGQFAVGMAARRAEGARRRQRVRRRHRRRRDPPQLHPGGGEGRARHRGDRRRARLPGRRREGHVLRRQAPPRRQLRDGIQDRGRRSASARRSARPNPILLEPVSELVVTVPEAYQGDIMGDLNSKRGRIQGSAAVGERRGRDRRPRADLRGVALRDRSPLDDGRPRPVHQRALALRPRSAHLTDKIVAAAKEAKA